MCVVEHKYVPGCVR